jgi:drug/metabolite transporter (DMT)-like permease
MCYIPLSYNDLASVEWTAISTAAYWQVAYVVLGGTFVAYICLMGAQQRLRPTVVSMYNYMQPIMASAVAIVLGMGSFNVQKVIAVVLVFTGVYIVTQSKSRRDLKVERKRR